MDARNKAGHDAESVSRVTPETKTPRESGAFCLLGGSRFKSQTAKSQKAKHSRSRIVFSAPRRRSLFPYPRREWSAGRRQSVCETLLTESANSAGTLAKRSASPNVREKRRLRALHPGGGYRAAGSFVPENIFLVREKSRFFRVVFLFVMPALIAGISLREALP